MKLPGEKFAGRESDEL